MVLRLKTWRIPATASSPPKALPTAASSPTRELPAAASSMTENSPSPLELKITINSGGPELLTSWRTPVVASSPPGELPSPPELKITVNSGDLELEEVENEHYALKPLENSSSHPFSSSYFTPRASPNYEDV
ncbi:hypothetical protein L484_011667 [Morus notabilis]|uniref:Uncharacterized protein n=1 Tax=Morus notabilis TaxID=981085 RepID=W9S429_9ROSA|nr:hypothetical protein L484_011667 [Morus notabilis]